MPLPSSGAISLSQVNTELGLSATATISMNDSAVRTLFGVGGSGTSISMSQGYGKANQFAFTISANQTNADLRTLAVNAGWNQSTKVVATIASGVVISSNSTGTPALTVSGSFPNGVDLVNNGVIVGMGGNGGRGGPLANNSAYQPPLSGSSGGLALSVSRAITINNGSGTIAGGGGGGGGGGGIASNSKFGYADLTGGGGGGGGRSSAAANSTGATGGSAPLYVGFSGAAGTYSAAGGGGGRRTNPSLNVPGSYAGAGGAGGNWGSSGGAGENGTNYNPQSGASGGAAGGAIAGNSNITWAATGTRLGGIS